MKTISIKEYQALTRLANDMRQIANINGNLPLTTLDGKVGPNESESRGIKLRACVEIAQASLTNLANEKIDSI